MEVSQLKSGFAMQGSVVQAKEKVSEESQQTNPDHAKAVELLQAKLAEKQERVQDSGAAQSQVNNGSGKGDSYFEIGQRVAEKLRSSGFKIQLNVNSELNKIFMVVKDPVTDEVVREIPSEDFLKIVESIKQASEKLRNSASEIDVKF